MKILLLCSAGMSTSLLVNKMKKCCETIGREDVFIEAKSIDELEDSIDEFDIVLLGPQIRYKEGWAKEIIEGKGKKYAIISSVIYGRIDGDSAIKLAFDLIYQ